MAARFTRRMSVYGIIPMAMVLAKSSNIGAIEIGLRVGQNNIYDYCRRFGFGERTGIPLPAESPGKLRKLPNVESASLTSISMGQEVGVTTFSWPRPAQRDCQRRFAGAAPADPEEGRSDRSARPPVRVIQPETAITMRQMMEGVVSVRHGKASSQAARL